MLHHQQLEETDPTIHQLLHDEIRRQSKQLQMIPSENYASKAVREAVGSPLMNKYSEGQVGKRYYQGNNIIDEIEKTAKIRALQLFGLDPLQWGVNVQAVTGSVANFAVYSAILEPGDKIMGMFLYDGGHLSHGWKLPNGKQVSFSSKIYDTAFYTVDPTKRTFDYDDVTEQIQKEKPKLIISGGTAYPREIDYKKMREIADSVGAIYLADIAHEAGLIAAGVNKSPFEHAHIVTMTTRKTLRGPVGSIIYANLDTMNDIDRAVFPGMQGGPQNHSIAGIAVALEEAMTDEFKAYSQQVVTNAHVLASELINYGFDVTSGGTDKHLLLIDLRSKDLAGTEVAEALEQANIIVNKNTVPNDSAKPWRPSGIRLGTPAITTRGLTEEHMKQIASWIHEVVENRNDEEIIHKIASEVELLTSQFPID